MTVAIRAVFLASFIEIVYAANHRVSRSGDERLIRSNEWLGSIG